MKCDRCGYGMRMVDVLGNKDSSACTGLTYVYGCIRCGEKREITVIVSAVTSTTFPLDRGWET